jgi:hypothetical protein
MPPLTVVYRTQVYFKIVFSCNSPQYEHVTVTLHQFLKLVRIYMGSVWDSLLRNLRQNANRSMIKI